MRHFIDTSLINKIIKFCLSQFVFEVLGRVRVKPLQTISEYWECRIVTQLTPLVSSSIVIWKTQSNDTWLSIGTRLTFLNFNWFTCAHLWCKLERGSDDANSYSTLLLTPLRCRILYDIVLYMNATFCRCWRVNWVNCIRRAVRFAISWIEIDSTMMIGLHCSNYTPKVFKWTARGG